MTLASRYGLQIRTAAPADAPGVAELLASAGHAVDATTLARQLENLRQGEGTALLALEWGPPSGLIVLHWLQLLGPDGRVAQVSGLLVGPDERRRGIGRLLLKAGARAARAAGCGSLHLLASAHMPAMLDFAGANGFDAVGTALVRPLRKSRGRDDD